MNVEQEARRILKSNERGSCILTKVNTGNMCTLINAARDAAETLILVPNKEAALKIEEDLDYFFALYHTLEVHIKHRPYWANFPSTGGRIIVRVHDNTDSFRGANPHVILFDEASFDQPEEKSLRPLEPVRMREGLIKSFFTKRKARKSTEQPITELEDFIKEGERILANADKMIAKHEKLQTEVRKILPPEKRY